MRRLISLLRTWGTYTVMVAVYALVRYWANAGHSPARFPDSLGYQTVRFFGTSERLWAVPFLYSLAHNDFQRVVLQIAVGVAAWAYLAWVLASVSRFRVSAMTVVFVVGLTPQVIRYDLAILSESLGISLAVVAVATTVHLSRTRSQTVRFAWCTSVVLVGFTRPIHLLVIFTITLYYVATYLLSRRNRRKASTIAFGLLSVWGVMQLQGNQSESTLNFYTILQQRICADSSQYAWFTARGMPDIPGVCNARGYAYAFEMKNTVGEILQLPEGQQPLKSMIVGDVELATWVRDHGWNTYLQYVFAHPGTVVTLLRKHATHTLDATSQQFLPTDSRTVLPYQLVNPWWLWATLGVACSVMGARHSRLIRMLTASAGLLAVVYTGTLLTSAVEIQRHAATSSVLLRVLVLVSIAAATAGPTLTRSDESFDEHGASSSRGTQKI